MWSLPYDRVMLTRQAKPKLASHAPIVKRIMAINISELGDIKI